MKDKNIVILEGVVGNDVKHAVARNGKHYITFSLCVNTYLPILHDSTESEHQMVYIRTFVYDQKHVSYLNAIGISKGDRVSLFGRLSTKGTEVKGKRVVSLSVIVRDVSVTKLPPSNVKTDNRNENEENDVTEQSILADEIE